MMAVHKPRPAHARTTHLFSALLFFSSALHAAAQGPPFDCRFSLGDLNYDLSDLAGPRVLSRTRDSPPSSYLDELRFDLCADLAAVDDRPSEDQCPSDTRACLTIINQKADNPDRVTAVVPIAQSSTLEVKTFPTSSPKGVAITFVGASYPPSSSSSVSQSLKMLLTCAEVASDPQFSSYENGEALVEWSLPVACGTTGTPKDGSGGGGSSNGGKEGETPIENVGSGLGFFFLMLILAFVAYFVVGAYHNYSTYGARGWDLIPHRDFWREVPYMLQDVIAHLCSSVRMRRSSRGGYIAV